jgi:hypothetical protein
MTLLQKLKELKSLAHAEAKEIFPFLQLEILLYSYSAHGERLNDGSDDEVGKLSKSNIDNAVAMLRAEYPETSKIELEFIYRGCDTMQELQDGYTDIADIVNGGMTVWVG